MWFSQGQSAFPECSLCPTELGEPLGRLPFFPRRGSKPFQKVHYSQGKVGAAQGTPSSDPRATLEREMKREERREEETRLRCVSRLIEGTNLAIVVRR